jgi:hypothetical protein
MMDYSHHTTQINIPCKLQQALLLDLTDDLGEKWGEALTINGKILEIWPHGQKGN